MRKKLALVLIWAGLLFAGWNAYYLAAGTLSGRETISENDIINTEIDANENLEQENSDVDSLSTVENAIGEPSYFLEKEKFISYKASKNKGKENPKPRDYKEYEKGAEVGWLLIPSLNMKYRIYWGTDNETLTQGVGYHVGKFTTPPDGLGHTVLSGHRETVFKELGELEEGAKMYIQFEDIQYEYEIKKMWVTDAQDRTVIVKKDEPTLTLTTCYPFNFIGSAPDRYIIESHLVNITEMSS